MLDLPSSREPRRETPVWVVSMLTAAGVYNLLWGVAVILFPAAIFEFTEIQPPRYPQIWQCVGMIVGVYGVGYLIAARDPCRHWPIVLVGLLGKVFGPIGFLFAAADGALPWSWGVVNIFNDLIWWLPFAYTLYLAARYNSDTSIGRPHDLDDTTLIFPSQQGTSLAELSQERPVMLVFLRHFGCTFCREALRDLSQVRGEVEELGFHIAVVHMSDSTTASERLNHYGLDGVAHFSDGHCEIYRSFGLDRGSATQLFGWYVWWRGLAATIRGHFVGRLAGDGFRMPGLFFLYRGEICGSYRHRSAADRPDYLGLARQVRQVLQGDAVAEMAGE
ncbi:MAG: SelL-related redox protein [Pirellulaceae bacterium]